MAIKGLESVTAEQLNQELNQGARFVVFSYAISVVILTFKRGSAIFYIRPGESVLVKGMPYTLLSLVAGWWGIPFGPIFTIWALVTNLGGGKDVTGDVIAAMNANSNPEELKTNGR